ncbi:2-amino-4-hydroxy-6-hydroxymethyldihydropteridine diphosphokinase [Paenibacillus methanolicus]|uniref:2-amino-4-hydroxy-6-hydroxymethyldihydropteridine diphosphokinase n=1 Tax=Paenibacillus methanolicus TaxID=582686 RepID=A0A5S5BPD6_9BACL|nr:2-amino-4-hydroxy-6-hydroxymethyldihydropteridine diphosphokinase [Paenibacillus methanolicus]TYP68032.1 2-amino-4-hydroxy-6-hydroxymethyldihydropteridine diphosphokinase [Paenibacillus methanolicus]
MASNVSQPKQAVAYIALGSNMGDRDQLLVQALNQLNDRPDIDVLRISGLYETDPVGYTDQPPFLNMAAALSTTLAPVELLRVMLGIEAELGRKRDIRWGPRTIDLDLLLYDDVRMDDQELTLPHPRMLERAFVLVPLRDVITQGHELFARVDQEAQRALQDGGEGIALWNTINWHNASAPLES